MANGSSATGSQSMVGGTASNATTKIQRPKWKPAPDLKSDLFLFPPQPRTVSLDSSRRLARAQARERKKQLLWKIEAASLITYSIQSTRGCRVQGPSSAVSHNISESRAGYELFIPYRNGDSISPLRLGCQCVFSCPNTAVGLAAVP